MPRIRHLVAFLQLRKWDKVVKTRNPLRELVSGWLIEAREEAEKKGIPPYDRRYPDYHHVPLLRLRLRLIKQALTA